MDATYYAVTEVIPQEGKGVQRDVSVSSTGAAMSSVKNAFEMYRYQLVTKEGLLCACAELYSTVHCSTVQYSDVLYSTMLYSTIQYCTMQYSHPSIQSVLYVIHPVIETSLLPSMSVLSQQPIYVTVLYCTALYFALL